MPLKSFFSQKFLSPQKMCPENAKETGWRLFILGYEKHKGDLFESSTIAAVLNVTINSTGGEMLDDDDDIFPSPDTTIVYKEDTDKDHGKLNCYRLLS